MHSVLGSLIVDLQQELITTDDRKGYCRFCGALNGAFDWGLQGEFDCCDPRPSQSFPDFFLSPHALEERQAVRAELAALSALLEIRRDAKRQP